MSYPIDSDSNEYVSGQTYLTDANGDEFYPRTHDDKLLIMMDKAFNPQFIAKRKDVSFVNLGDQLVIHSKQYFVSEPGVVGSFYLEIMTSHTDSPYDDIYNRWKTAGMKNEPFQFLREIQSLDVYSRGPSIHFIFHRDMELFVEDITLQTWRYFIMDPDKKYVDVNYNEDLVIYETDADGRKTYYTGQGQRMITATTEYTLPSNGKIEIAGMTFDLASDRFWQDMDRDGYIFCYDEDGRYFDYSNGGIRYFYFSFGWTSKFYYDVNTKMYLGPRPSSDEPLNVRQDATYEKDAGGSEVYPIHKDRQYCLPNGKYAKNAKGEYYYPKRMVEGAQMVLLDYVTGDPVLIPGTNPDLTTIDMNYPDASYRLVKFVKKGNYFYHFVLVVVGAMIAVVCWYRGNSRP